MKRLSILVFLLLVASLKVSCTGPAASPAPNSSMLQPGDTLGDAVLKIAEDETAEPDIFTYCNPLIAESDPRVMVRTCNVPQLPYLFIGYGELANTQQELETLWKAESWQLYFDEHAVDLQSFGAFDTDWEGYRLRRWKIAVENLPPGEHSLLSSAALLTRRSCSKISPGSLPWATLHPSPLHHWRRSCIPISLLKLLLANIHTHRKNLD